MVVMLSQCYHSYQWNFNSAIFDIYLQLFPCHHVREKGYQPPRNMYQDGGFHSARKMARTTRSSALQAGTVGVLMTMEGKLLDLEEEDGQTVTQQVKMRLTSTS